jgi:predicted RNase H-like HicB family nuclease
MEFRAVINKSDNWWIGWLVDLPGVNAQERTRQQVVKSLRLGAQEMLATEIPFDADGLMVTIEVPDPAWAV